ncbi:unnamed protein product [Sphacelaria rigidula]
MGHFFFLNLSRHLLYVHLAVPIHFLRVFFHFCDGNSSSFLPPTTSSSVVSGDEEVTHGKEIFGKFCAVVGSFSRTRNHDLRPVVFAEQLEEFKSVPTEPILVGDDNLSDNLSEDSVQNGFKALSPEVEP